LFSFLYKITDKLPMRALLSTFLICLFPIIGMTQVRTTGGGAGLDFIPKSEMLSRVVYIEKKLRELLIKKNSSCGQFVKINARDNLLAIYHKVTLTQSVQADRPSCEQNCA